MDGPVAHEDIHEKDLTIQEVAKEEVSTDCTLLPGGCASKVQPLDVSTNKPFKGVLRACSLRYIQCTVRAHSRSYDGSEDQDPNSI